MLSQIKHLASILLRSQLVLFIAITVLLLAPNPAQAEHSLSIDSPPYLAGTQLTGALLGATNNSCYGFDLGGGLISSVNIEDICTLGLNTNGILAKNNQVKFKIPGLSVGNYTLDAYGSTVAEPDDLNKVATKDFAVIRDSDDMEFTVEALPNPGAENSPIVLKATGCTANVTVHFEWKKDGGVCDGVDDGSESDCAEDVSSPSSSANYTKSNFSVGSYELTAICQEEESITATSTFTIKESGEADACPVCKTSHPYYKSYGADAGCYDNPNFLRTPESLETGTEQYCHKLACVRGKGCKDSFINPALPISPCKVAFIYKRNEDGSIFKNDAKLPEIESTKEIPTGLSQSDLKEEMKDQDGCLTVDTAVGGITASPTGLVRSVMAILLSLSGGIALILIIVSGYKLMNSKGDPEKIQAAKDRLTSAIIGLLFIIFSVVIVEVIGVDILRIPGFNR